MHIACAVDASNSGSHRKLVTVLVPPSTDVLTPAQRRQAMQAVRSHDTQPELRLRRALWASGLRYRLRVAIPGKPDIAFLRARVAVFVDGCFWHGCPIHGSYPKTRAEWWAAKLSRNRERDAEVNSQLEALGWQVIRVWEHELSGGKDCDLPGVVARIEAVVRPQGAD
jgi:DNA mismatch endonuclease (patch repair protein)